MTLSINECVDRMTANVRDIQAKPALRPVIAAELLKLGFDAESVETALNKTFKVTLQ